MPVPVWVPGQLLNAGDVNAWMVPNGAYKTAQTSRSTGIGAQPPTTLVADPDLELNFTQGGTWIIEAVIRFHGPASNNLAWSWQTNATAISGSVAAIFNNNTGALEVSYRAWTFLGSLAQTTGVGAEWTIRFNGLVTVPMGVPSSLAFAWAQGTSSATVTGVDVGSYLLGWRAN
jgi:hypothetical protein